MNFFKQMERQQLIDLFNKYLKRLPSEYEILNHQRKNLKKFEIELSRCEEYIRLQTPPKIVIPKIKKKGKIAILISGHIRRSNISKSFKLLDDYDYDVFIHTWDNLGFKGSETNLNDQISSTLISRKVSEIPNVKSFEMENNKKFITELKPVDFSYFNCSSDEVFIKSQLYSINRSFTLFEEYQKSTNTNYDLVIRTRFENEFTEFLVDEELLNDVKNKIVFVPNSDCGHHHPDSNSTTCLTCEKMFEQHKLKHVHIFDHTHVICDIFAYGNQESMKQYCSLNENYDSLNESFEDNNIERLITNNITHQVKKNVYLLDKNHHGHINSLYYLNCSYPERLLQFQLKDYLLPTSKKIKIKFHR